MKPVGGPSQRREPRAERWGNHLPILSAPGLNSTSGETEMWSCVSPGVLSPVVEVRKLGEGWSSPEPCPLPRPLGLAGALAALSVTLRVLLFLPLRHLQPCL